jgi:anaerobic selenocysteine-containing dehydrogenase
MKGQRKKITRRKFMDLGVQGYAGLGITQAVGGSLLTLGCTEEARAKVVHGACYHDCPDTCSWTTTTVNNLVTRFEASTSNPYTAGKLCGKMDDFPNSVTFHPDRILTALKRTGNKGEGLFEPISWEKALTEVSERLSSIIKAHGGESVLPYSFAGTEGLIQKNLISGRFFARLGASRLERAICGDAAVTGVLYTNGQTTGVLPEDMVYSKYIILWGTNTITSNQHLWPLIQQARNKGAKLVVVDPFVSHTAMEADQHIQLMPGTDSLLALGLMQVIIEENLYDKSYVNSYTVGFKELSEHVKSFDPASIALTTGIPPETIRNLAREYANASPSLIRVLIGMEHQSNGAGAFRAVSILPALTGAWQKRGGGLMHMTYELFGESLNWERLNLIQQIENPATRSINMSQLGMALTETTSPPVHSLFVYNSNPAVIAPNQNKVLEGLRREDLFTVVLEHFMTDTARYADYIFPATTQLEHWDLMTSWGQTYINLNEPALAPRGDSKTNTEFFRLLADKMNLKEDYLYEGDLELIKSALKTNHPYMEGITFESLRKSGWARLNLPEPWLPHEKGNFKTPSGKCEFFSESMATEGLSPLPAYVPVILSDEVKEKFPLQLLSIKSTRNFLNTSHANVSGLRKKEGEPQLDIHPEDAFARNISDKSTVRVFNENGEVLLTASVRSKVPKGVVCMPQGHWPSLIKGGSSANALTEELLTDMGGGAALNEARVEVQPV